MAKLEDIEQNLKTQKSNDANEHEDYIQKAHPYGVPAARMYRGNDTDESVKNRGNHYLQTALEL